MTKEEKIKYRVSKFDVETIHESCCSILRSGNCTHQNYDLRSQPIAKISWMSDSHQFHLEKYPVVVATTKEQPNILLYPSVNCQALAKAIVWTDGKFEFSKNMQSQGQ
ncbi:hypothetical protein JMG10_40785 [Nostoc ellipsosporum NOK]|nr:hypothetical protein [Nostoc ellipsosporum NOK]